MDKMERNMEIYRDGVECFVILGFCEADDKRKSIFELEQCPLGKDECSGDCEYYSEDLKG